MNIRHQETPRLTVGRAAAFHLNKVTMCGSDYASCIAVKEIEEKSNNVKAAAAVGKVANEH